MRKATFTIKGRSHVTSKFTCPRSFRIYHQHAYHRKGDDPPRRAAPPHGFRAARARISKHGFKRSDRSVAARWKGLAAHVDECEGRRRDGGPWSETATTSSRGAVPLGE